MFYDDFQLLNNVNFNVLVSILLLLHHILMDELLHNLEL